MLRVAFRLMLATTMRSVVGFASGGGGATLARRAPRGRLLASVSGVSQSPPVAPRRPHAVTFGQVEGENRGPNPMVPITVDDDLFWLRDDARESPEVLALLEEENTFAQAATAHLETTREALYAELKGRMQESDVSAPFARGVFEYYRRTIEGKSYVIHCRRPRPPPAGPLPLPLPPHDAPAADEVAVLDENELADGLTHCDVGAVEPSPSGALLAWSVDGVGYETYQARFSRIAPPGARSAPLADVLEVRADDGVCLAAYGSGGVATTQRAATGSVGPYITLHCITLYYITLHYIALHYITLHYITCCHGLSALRARTRRARARAPPATSCGAATTRASSIPSTTRRTGRTRCGGTCTLHDMTLHIALHCIALSYIPLHVAFGIYREPNLSTQVESR